MAKAKTARVNRPNWKIHALNKLTRAKAQIGVGWNMEGPRGSVSIKLNDFLDLNIFKDPNVIVTMFPED